MKLKAIKECLALKDLSDPKNGIHAVNLLIQKIKHKFEREQGFPNVCIRRNNVISNTFDEFDKLFITCDNKQRSSSYVKYINQTTLLRSHVTPIVPKFLKEIREKNINDCILFAPGICFGRYLINKKKGLAPHKMDIWRIQRRRDNFQRSDLLHHVEILLRSISFSMNYKVTETSHPYTENGITVEAEFKPNEWIKILDGGEAAPILLKDAGLNPKEYSGVAMGIGLDRLVMVLKEIDDIRLLRSLNPVIVEQMKNLNPLKGFGEFARFEKEFSVIVPKELAEGHLCEIIQEALGPEIDSIESVSITKVIDTAEKIEVENIILKPHQKLIGFKVVFNAVDRNLELNEVKSLTDKIYFTFRSQDLILQTL